MRRKHWALGVWGAALALAGACSGSKSADQPPDGTGGATAGHGGASGTGEMSAGKGGSGAGAGGMSGAGGDSGEGGTSAGAGGTTPVGECASTEDKRTGSECADAAQGVFAIKTVIDVWWQDPGEPDIVDAGRDKIVAYLMGELSEVCSDGSGGKGIVKACGTELPPFKSDANCDAFQIEFPNELWDSPSMPTFTTTGMTTGFNPGDTLTLLAATGLVGINLDDIDGAWPTAEETATFTCPEGTGVECFVDHDGDGKPGISIRMGKIGEQLSPNGCGGFNAPFVFRGAPLTTLSAADDNSVRAEKLNIGLRLRIGGAGEVGDGCSSGVGAATAELINSRVWSCVRSDGEDCSESEAAYVDTRAPEYQVLEEGEAPPPDVKTMGLNGQQLDQTPSRGPRASMVRLGDLDGGFDCADVRAAAYPEP